ncbi:MAG: 3'(2'),5'-bisphosphate nucleotidase CysQ family protein [Acidiferrobacteraceae bacterium]
MKSAVPETMALLEAAKTAVLEAGAVILACPPPQGGFPANGQTAADRQAHRIITEVLSRLASHLPIASEEGDRHVVAGRYWLVDPLDGTKEYVAGNGQYTVNVALIEGGYPVLGAVYVPAADALYWGALDLGAWVLRGSETRPLPVEAQGGALRVLTSRSHSSPAMQRAADTLRAEGAVIEHLGSSWKFARVAEGSADLYVRLSPTYAWDTAAGQCLVEAAGGFVGGPGGRLRYVVSDALTPGFIVARSAKAWHDWAGVIGLAQISEGGG